MKSKGKFHILTFISFNQAEAASGATASSVDKEVPPQIVNGKPQLPFQLQLEYTSSDGDRCLRVITQTKPVTKDRKVAEKGIICLSYCTSIYQIIL